MSYRHKITELMKKKRQVVSGHTHQEFHPRKRINDDINCMKPPFKTETIDDLLYLAWNYHGSLFDSKKLWSLIPQLTKLNSLVGMQELKKRVIENILYYIQNLNNKGNEDEMLHTALFGPPGVGKTTVASILASIYCKLGFLRTNKVVCLNKDDYMGKYVGMTESKTRKIFNSALGGVLLIDEAYSLGSEGRTDSFSQTFMNMLVKQLTDYAHDFVCIIAGYEEQIEKRVFSFNPGFRSRFPIKIRIKPYTAGELCQIFAHKTISSRWKLCDTSLSESFFEKNKAAFPNFGRSMQTLLQACKVVHSKRIFGTTQVRRLLTKDDIEAGLVRMMGKKKKTPVLSYFI